MDGGIGGKDRKNTKRITFARMSQVNRQSEHCVRSKKMNSVRPWQAVRAAAASSSTALHTLRKGKQVEVVQARLRLRSMGKPCLCDMFCEPTEIRGYPPEYIQEHDCLFPVRLFLP